MHLDNLHLRRIGHIRYHLCQRRGARRQPRKVHSWSANSSRDSEFDALQLHPQMKELLCTHPPPPTTPVTSPVYQGVVTTAAIRTAGELPARTARSQIWANAQASRLTCALTLRLSLRLQQWPASDGDAMRRRLRQLCHLAPPCPPPPLTRRHRHIRERE
jgi:hypothetical protein